MATAPGGIEPAMIVARELDIRIVSIGVGSCDYLLRSDA